MSTVYIISQNGTLNKENEILHYSDYTGNVIKLIPSKVTQIVVFGNLEISGQALHLIISHKIAVSFLYKNGRYNGKLVFQDNKNVLLRHRQHQMLDNPEIVLQVAKDIVRGKIHNEYLFVQRIGRKLPNEKQLMDSIVKMESLRVRLEQSRTIDEVRGYEGMAANEYFKCLHYNINSSWAKFNGRSKNPPKDEVNSVLSFLYTVLASRIDSLINLEGLDSSVGTLHALSYGRKSLVFDLIEEYRTPLVDFLVCAMFNQGSFTQMDFRKEPIDIDISEDEDSITEQIEVPETEQGVLLTEDGMKKVLILFENKLDQEHNYPYLNKRLPYRTILHEQIKRYKQVVGGMMDHYLPLVVS